MRKRLSLCLLVAGSFCAGALYVGIPVGAGPVERPSTGDTNADGILDVSDAVYLLRYLFDGGEAPAACADSPELVERVEALEDNLSDVVPLLERIAIATEANGTTLEQIAAATATGADALSREIEVAIPCEERIDRFVEHGDGTVTDTCSGLMWFDVTADLNGDGRIDSTNDGRDSLNWQDAIDYCEDLEFAGHSDWRLPTILELSTILDNRVRWTRAVNPAINPIGGDSRQHHWSSTTYKANSSEAWRLRFQAYSGNSGERFQQTRSAKSNPLWLLPVRDAE